LSVLFVFLYLVVLVLLFCCPSVVALGWLYR